MEKIKNAIKNRATPKRTFFEQIIGIAKLGLAFYVLSNIFSFCYRVAFTSNVNEGSSNLILGIFGTILGTIVGYYFANASDEKSKKKEDEEDDENESNLKSHPEKPTKPPV